MTQLDVLYRYGVPPTERAVLALSKVRDVYGVRRMAFDEGAKTVRVEYDASRLTEPVIHQLLRRAGLDIVETVAMIAEPEDVAPPAPVQPSVPRRKVWESSRPASVSPCKMMLRTIRFAPCARSSAG